MPQGMRGRDWGHRGVGRTRTWLVQAWHTAGPALANDVEYGLHTYVCGEDQERARTVLAGRVMINEIVGDPTSSFGGFKMSGFGREFGIYGLHAYLETRTVYAN